MPRQSSDQTIEIRSIEGDDIETLIVARSVWRRLDDGRYAGRVRITEPSELAGMCVLVRERAPGAALAEGPSAGEIFLYLPEFGRVRRVSMRQATTSLFGSAFSYADLDRVQGHVRDARVSVGRDAVISNRPAYVVTAEPRNASGSPYTEIRSYIDKQTCLPLRVEYRGSGAAPSKILTADPATFERVQGVWIARSVSMTDVESGVASELRIRSIQIDGNVPETWFLPASLASDF
jgi:hypothetical protein